MSKPTETFINAVEGQELSAVFNAAEQENEEKNMKTNKVRMSDADLMNLAGGVIKMPSLVIGYERKKKTPLVASSIHYGKGNLRGALYENSPYEDNVRDLKQNADGFTEKPVNETKNGLVQEAISLLGDMPDKTAILNQMMSLKEANNVIDGTLSTYYQTYYGGIQDDPSMSQQQKDKLMFSRMNHVYQVVTEQLAQAERSNFKNVILTLVLYKKRFSLVQNEIEKVRRPLLAEYQDTFSDLVNPNQKKLNWLVDKLKPSQDIVNQASMLTAEKDIVVATFKSLAEKYTLDDAEWNVALYAKLYMMTVEHNESFRIKNKEQFITNKVNAYTSQYMNAPAGEALALIHQEAEEAANQISDKGYSSIQTLYPLSSVQFLEYIDKHEIITQKQKGRCVCAHLTGNMVTPDAIKQFKDARGTYVQFNNRMLFGYTVNNKEDMLRLEDDYVSPTAEQIAKLNYPEGEIYDKMTDILKNEAFLRGAKVWLGGIQQGILLEAVEYKNSVKVYLADMKTIG